MVTKEQVHSMRNKTPFVPFVIHTSKGEAIRVLDRQLILSASQAPRVIVKEPGGPFYFIPVETITSLEQEPLATAN